MNQYSDLEISILSCFLQKPSLMKKTILDDKYFIKHQKIWQFMKAVYKKFEDFDLNIMMAVSKNKYRTMEYIIWLLDQEPCISKFKVYEQQLIEDYRKNKKEKYIIQKIFELANDLYVGNISVAEFNNKLNETYKTAKEIFDKSKEN